MCHSIAIAYLSLRKMMGIYSEGMLISAVHEVLKLLMVDDKIFAGVKLYYN
jgi:lysine--tRNA ligase